MNKYTRQLYFIYWLVIALVSQKNLKNISKCWVWVGSTKMDWTLSDKYCLCPVQVSKKLIVCVILPETSKEYTIAVCDFLRIVDGQMYYLLAMTYRIKVITYRMTYTYVCVWLHYWPIYCYHQYQCCSMD